MAAVGSQSPVQSPNSVHVATEEHQALNESLCLMLGDDDTPEVKPIEFRRDETSLNESAARALGLANERVRCFTVPYFYKHGYAMHMYIDLEGTKHGHAHNTNATQLWLLANLPAEPPEVQPDSINGPVLLCAEDPKGSGLYLDLSSEDWERVKGICRDIQPSATFSS